MHYYDIEFDYNAHASVLPKTPEVQSVPDMNKILDKCRSVKLINSLIEIDPLDDFAEIQYGSKLKT